MDMLPKPNKASTENLGALPSLSYLTYLIFIILYVVHIGIKSQESELMAHIHKL